MGVSRNYARSSDRDYSCHSRESRAEDCRDLDWKFWIITRRVSEGFVGTQPNGLNSIPHLRFGLLFGSEVSDVQLHFARPPLRCFSVAEVVRPWTK